MRACGLAFYREVNDHAVVGPLESNGFLEVNPRRSADGCARELPLQRDGGALRNQREDGPSAGQVRG